MSTERVTYEIGTLVPFQVDEHVGDDWKLGSNEK